MPSYRYYKKRYYKSKYNRYRRQKFKFSRFNTYKNRSSKAQAYQIYSLNKRVSRIEGNTKPELLEFTPATRTYEFQKQTIENNWDMGNNYPITDLGSGFGQVIKNSSCRINKILVWGTLERDPDGVDFDRDVNGYVRIVVFQYTAARLADVDPTTIFDADNGPSSYYAPLKKGCNTHGRILKVLKMKMSSMDPTTKPFRLVIKPKYKIVRKPNSGEDLSATRMKGGICLCVCGLKELNGGVDAQNKIYLTVNSKVLYYDA